MNKGSQKNKKRKDVTAPRLKWQTGDYTRFAEFHFHLPYQFLLLCKLMNVTPGQVLLDVMDVLDCGSYTREETSKAKQLLSDYFIEQGYGKDFYTEEDRRKMFEELNAIGTLWPHDAKMKFIEFHAEWRNKYQDYWFKKWFRKLRRKD